MAQMDDSQARTGSMPRASEELLGGRYRLEAMLGQGGMAQVFRAHDEVLHRRVAVKIFRTDAAWGDDRRREQSEVRLLAGLTHPALVVVHDAGHDFTSAGLPRSFLVMELVDGPTLAQLLKGAGPLPSPQTAQLGQQIAGALAYVHKRSLVHRDVKPGNVLLAGDPVEGLPVVAKLADFGIARMVDATRLTVTGTTLGTAQYLSPEQARGAVVGPPADVYSLGLVLLECLTGRVAYPGNAVEAAVARLHRPPDIPAELGPAWCVLLTAMTDTDPGSRPTAGDVAAALAPMTGEQTERLESHTLVMAATEAAAPVAPPRHTLTLPAPTAAWVRNTSSRSRRAVVAAVLLGLAALTLGMLLVGSGRDSPAAGKPPPAYPSVGGQLGADLKDLQRSVLP